MPQGYEGLPSLYAMSSNPITVNLGLSLKGMDPIVAEDFVLIDNAFGGGLGTTVEVNGVNVANPNFNDLLPAPPLGFTNVLWQVVGSSVSGYVPMGGGGTPSAPLDSLQYNNGGVFGGMSGSVVDGPSGTLIISPPDGGLGLVAALNIVGDDVTTNILDIYKNGDTPGSSTPVFFVASNGYTGGNTFDSVMGYRVNGVATSGNVLRGNGTNFVDAQLQYSDLGGIPDLAGDVTGPATSNTIEEIQGYPVLASGINAPVPGQVLQYDGANWTPNSLALASILYFSTDQSFADFPGISLVLSQVGVVGTTVTYTGTITNGASNWYLGKKFQIAGFTNPNNNGLITVTASTATTLVCTHASQANETDPATATEIYHGWDTVVDPNPEATTVLAATSAMGNVVLESFGTISGYPNVTSIPAGEWIADLYIQTNTAAGTQTGYVQILARHLDGTETALFDTSGTPFVFNGNGTTVNHYTVEVVETAFTILTTDTLVCKIWINVSANRTVTLYYGGTTHYSHIHTPIGSVTAPVTSVFGRFGNVVATAGDYPWNFNGNATADLVLANDGFNTTFNQSSAVNWKWANTTPATVSVPQPSPILALSGQYWATGAVTGEDKWTIQPVLTAGLNGASTLTIAHTGSTGAARVNLPLLSLGGIDAGISRLGAASLAIGNGTAGDLSGTISATTLLLGASGNSKIWNSGSSGLTFNFASTDIFSITGTRMALKAGIPMGWATALNSNSDVAISRLGAASLAIGNGTAGDTTGNLSFNTVINYGGTATVSQGIPSEIIAIDLTAQSAAIGATNIIASAPRSGMYRISWSADITTAATTSSVLGGTNGFQVGYTSPTDSVAKTTVPGNSTTSAGNTTGTAVSGSITVFAKIATAITYAYDYTSVGVTGMQFELHVRLEAM